MRTTLPTVEQAAAYISHYTLPLRDDESIHALTTVPSTVTNLRGWTQLHEAKFTREEADKKGSRQIPSNDLFF